jgi:hypothetical protein
MKPATAYLLCLSLAAVFGAAPAHAQVNFASVPVKNSCPPHWNLTLNPLGLQLPSGDAQVVTGRVTSIRSALVDYFPQGNVGINPGSVCLFDQCQNNVSIMLACRLTTMSRTSTQTVTFKSRKKR